MRENLLNGIYFFCFETCLGYLGCERARESKTKDQSDPDQKLPEELYIYLLFISS